MANPSEYRHLRDVSPQALEGWVRERYPSGRPTQWWFSLLQSMEMDIIATLRANGQLGQLLDSADVMLSLAAANTNEALLACYWRLRIASAVDGLKGASTQVPAALTVDGAVRFALSQIKPSKDSVRSIGRRRNSVLFGDGTLHIDEAEMRFEK